MLDLVVIEFVVNLVVIDAVLRLMVIVLNLMIIVHLIIAQRSYSLTAKALTYVRDVGVIPSEISPKHSYIRQIFLGERSEPSSTHKISTERGI